MKWKPNDIRVDGYGNKLWANRDGMVMFKTPNGPKARPIGVFQEEAELLTYTDVRDLRYDEGLIPVLLLDFPVDAFIMEDSSGSGVTLAVDRKIVEGKGTRESSVGQLDYIRVPKMYWRKM